MSNVDPFVLKHWCTCTVPFCSFFAMPNTYWYLDLKARVLGKGTGVPMNPPPSLCKPFLSINSHEWPRQNFSSQCQYKNCIADSEVNYLNDLGVKELCKQPTIFWWKVLAMPLKRALTNQSFPLLPPSLNPVLSMKWCNHEFQPNW